MGKMDIVGNDKKYLVIISALVQELLPFFQKFQLERTEFEKGRTVWKGSFYGVPTILFSSGVGEKLGSYTVQTVVDKYPIRFAFLLGVAGGVAPSAAVGDVIIPQEIKSLHSDVAFPLDRSLLPMDLMRQFQNEVEKFPIRNGGTLLTVDRVFGPKEKQSIHDPGVMAVDMESYAWVQIVRKRAIPFLVIRGISDHWNSAVPPPLFSRNRGHRSVTGWENVQNLLNPLSWFARFRFRKDMGYAIQNYCKVVDYLIESGYPFH